jgi:hypothetical protein
MTWRQQVFHIARKDVLFGRWYFLTHIAVVAAIVIFGPRPDYSAVISALSPVTMLLAMFFVAAVVQNDSAVAVDAFWATRPMSPTAVFAAKIVAIAVGMVLPSLIGQAVVLLQFGIGGFGLIELLGASLLSYIVFLGVPIAAAALTGDLSKFTAALFGVGFVMITVSSFASGRELTRDVPWFVGVMATLGPIAIGLWAAVEQYRTRRLWRGMTIGSAAVALGAVVPFTDASPVKPWVSADDRIVARAAAVDTRRGDLRITFAPHRVDSLSSIMIRRPRILLAGRQVNEKEDVIRIREGGVPLPTGMRWVMAQKPLDSMYVEQTVSADIAREMRGRPVALTVSGDAIVKTPYLVGSIPLRAGERIASPGFRTRVDSVTGGADPLIAYHESVAYDSRGFASTENRTQYLLVNRRRGEATRAEPRTVGMVHLTLPLPSVAVIQAEGFLKPALTREQIQDGWLTDAELIVVRWRISRYEPFRVQVDSVVLQDPAALGRRTP